jgi:glycerophosphoryl diester phosphodiesterase
LAEVFALVRKSGNTHVRLNIETKIDPNHPDESPDAEHFVAIVLDLLKREKFEKRVTLQSFDWRTLVLFHQRAPEIPTVFLTQQSGDDANVFLDKPSPWTAGFDPMRYGGSLPKAMKAAGGSIWSPLYTDVNPAVIAEAHGLGLTIVVWTVNDPADMAKLIDMGVDGIISDRPDLLRQVAGEKDITLPAPTPVTP